MFADVLLPSGAIALGAVAVVLWARAGASKPPTAPRSRAMLAFERYVAGLPPAELSLYAMEAIEGGDEALGEPPQYVDLWTREAFRGWIRQREHG